MANPLREVFDFIQEFWEICPKPILWFVYLIFGILLISVVIRFLISAI